MTGHTISTGVKHLRTFHIFALTSISFKDYPFLKDMMGGSLKICLSSGCSCMMCHFFIKICLMFGTAGSYFVTKGKISFIFFFWFFLSADFLSVKLISDRCLSIRFSG